MQRFGSLRPEPGDDDRDVLGRLRRAAAGLTSRLSGGRSQQALPMDRVRGQAGPVVPYQERHQQRLRSRRGQHSSYALAFVVILLVLVIGLFYGLTWALGGLSLGGGSRATPIPQPRPTAAAVSIDPTATPGLVVLPTPAPGGSLPSPSPSPASPAAGATPAPGPGTPEGRTYTVKPGDNPGQIARQFGVSVEALMRANNITDARALRVGQQLTIPAAATSTPAPAR